MSTRLLPVALLSLSLPTALLAQEHSWSVRTRLLAVSQNQSSEPAGYTVYSAFPLELSLSRDLGPRASVELAVRNESREVDQAQAAGPDLRLGSIELLPVNLLVQLRPFSLGAVRPYIGAGGNVTFGWEKSGVLDPMALSTTLGPAVQIGFDVDLSSYAVLNVDYRWNTMRTDLKSAGTQVATLSIDPAAIGIGIGMRF